MDNSRLFAFLHCACTHAVASFQAVRGRRPQDRDSARKAWTQACRRIIRREGSKPWQWRRKRRRWRSREPESNDASARPVLGPALPYFVTAAGLKSGRYCFVAHSIGKDQRASNLLPLILSFYRVEFEGHW